jgi:hypothetical protein
MAEEASMELLVSAMTSKNKSGEFGEDQLTKREWRKVENLQMEERTRRERSTGKSKKPTGAREAVILDRGFKCGCWLHGLNCLPSWDEVTARWGA